MASPQLIERVNFMHRIAEQNAQTVAWTRTTRAAVARQAGLLATLEGRDQKLTAQVLAQRNSVAALQAALLRRQISEVASRGRDIVEAARLNGRLASLEAKAAAEAAPRPPPPHNVSVGGIAVDTGGMVQAPPGAPAAVAQVIAAGNAIATLPYIYGGGHASFHADGYDCSGSVSYALAAAGLVSSPMVSGRFRGLGRTRPGPLDHDLRERRPRLDGRRRLAVRHGRAGRGRDALVARWRRVLGLRGPAPAGAVAAASAPVARPDV